MGATSSTVFAAADVSAVDATPVVAAPLSADAAIANDRVSEPVRYEPAPADAAPRTPPRRTSPANEDAENARLCVTCVSTRFAVAEPTAPARAPQAGTPTPVQPIATPHRPPTTTPAATPAIAPPYRCQKPCCAPPGVQDDAFARFPANGLAGCSSVEAGVLRDEPPLGVENADWEDFAVVELELAFLPPEAVRLPPPDGSENAAECSPVASDRVTGCCSRTRRPTTAGDQSDP